MEGTNLLSSSLVGDGGSSWRLKALKRAQDQAARSGLKLESLVEERWGSLGQLAVSVASGPAAPSHTHLHAINNRKRGTEVEHKMVAHNLNGRATMKDIDPGGLRDVSKRQMRMPKLHDSVSSWEKQKRQSMSTEDAGLISSVISSLNKFTNDGSFMREVLSQQNDDSSGKKLESELVSSELGKPSGEAVVKLSLSGNQFAAKVLQLRMKGKHEEADKFMKEARKNAGKHSPGYESSRTLNNEYEFDEVR